MHAKSNKFETARVCASGDSIVYAWGSDAPELKLPPGVGFKVGGDTAIQYLVLQVHYKDVSSFLPPSESSYSRRTAIIVLFVSMQKYFYVRYSFLCFTVFVLAFICFIVKPFRRCQVLGLSPRSFISKTVKQPR